MKRIILLIIIVAAVMVTACQQARQPKGIEHIVVIGLDGLSTWGMLEARTPTLDSLMQQGAYNMNVRGVLPTVTVPNWTAMLTGVGPEGSGSIDNSWDNGATAFPYAAMTAERNIPTIFSVIREQRPEAVMGCIYSWRPFENIYEATDLNMSQYREKMEDVARESASYIKAQKPNFMFCYFAEPDYALHDYGHLSQEYIRTVEELDGHIRTIIRSIHDAGIADRTVIMFTSDHGGVFYGHGGTTWEELNTPFIFAGRGIRKNYRIRQQMYRYDLAADVAFALGLTPPQQWVGRPTKAAYTAFDEPDGIYVGAETLPAPVFASRKVSGTNTYGGVWVDEAPLVDIKIRPDVDGEIRYTTDGSEPVRESPLYDKPFRLDTPSVVKAKIFNDRGQSMTVQAHYRMADSMACNGIFYDIYHLPNEQGLPKSFMRFSPEEYGKCYEFGFDTPENCPDMPLNKAIAQYKDHIAVEFSAKLQIDFDAEYEFNIWSTGASKMYINEKPIVNNSSNEHSGASGRAMLKKGQHNVRIEFFHNDGAAGSILNVTYSAPGLPRQPIPAQKLHVLPPPPPPIPLFFDLIPPILDSNRE